LTFLNRKLRAGNMRRGLLWLASVLVALNAAQLVAAEDFAYDTVVKPWSRPAWLDHVYLFEPAYQPVLVNGEIAPWAKKMQEQGIVLAAMYNDGFCRLSGDAVNDPWARDCREEVARMKAIGVKCIAGSYPFVASRGPGDFLKAHPEWTKLRPDGKPDPNELQACMLNPEFAKALRELLVSRVVDFGIDGWQFDGWYQREYCSCQSCRDQYKAEKGLDIPPTNDPGDVNYIKYMVWRDGKLLKTLEDLQTALKAANPEAVLVNWNCNDAAGATPSSMPEQLNAVADWTNKEWWDAADVYSIWLNLRLRGSSGDERPVGMQPYTFMRWGKDIQSGVYHGSSTPLGEVLYRMHEAMAMGGIPIIWSGMRMGWKPEDWDKVHADLQTFLPYVHTTHTDKWAVAIDSFTSLQNARVKVTNRAFHEGDGNEADRAVGYFRGGMARALLEEQLPLDVISEHNVTLEMLQQYKVVVLPNNFAMSERIADVLREYVKQGGGLVATFQTSLYDIWGQQRPDFLLADVFGASFKGSKVAGPNRVGFSDQISAITSDPYLLDLMGTRGYTTYWGAYSQVDAHEGTFVPMTGVDVEKDTEDGRISWKPLILNEFGSGRVAYFPAAIDAAYFDAGYPYQRVLLANAIRWAAREKPRHQVEAPMCVMARYMTQQIDGKHREVIHLLNDVATSTGHGSKNDKEMSFREEVLPIVGVKVTLGGEKPARVWFVGDDGQPDRTLEPRQVEGGWQVDVPTLGLHAVVAAEYSAGAK
jgi:type 1 glutamine amidotransferase